MKIGVLENMMCDVPFEEGLLFFQTLGIDCIEIGCGGSPGNEHCKPELLLHDEKALADFAEKIAAAGLRISALSAHGNPVHPIEEIGKKYDRDLKNAVLLAEKLGVDTICTFSGAPGDADGSECPVWVTSVWPYDGIRILDFQWNEKLIPYWRDFAVFAQDHGVEKIAFEMHPGFCVYNPETLLRLRAACGDAIGANFDPSHILWQGIDCPTAILKLKDCLYHFHAKDTQVNREEMAKNGFFAPYANPLDAARPFQFKIPPYGTGEAHWRQMMTALQEIGYDGALSIEHEDMEFGQREGLEKAVGFLRSIIYTEDPSHCAWKAPLKAYQKNFLWDGKEGWS